MDAGVIDDFAHAATADAAASECRIRRANNFVFYCQRPVKRRLNDCYVVRNDNAASLRKTDMATKAHRLAHGRIDVDLAFRLLLPPGRYSRVHRACYGEGAD